MSGADAFTTVETGKLVSDLVVSGADVFTNVGAGSLIITVLLLVG